MRAESVETTQSAENLGSKDVNGHSEKILALAKAKMALSPINANVLTAKMFGESTFGHTPLTEAVMEMESKADALKKGCLHEAESMLMAQAVALDAIFNDLARRAAVSLENYPSATETYLRLALKAQGQCRATLQTLGEVKNPRALAFVRQANISQGPQQVNNGVPGSEPPRAKNAHNLSNELLEADYGERLDTGTTCKAIDADSEMASVGKINGATH